MMAGVALHLMERPFPGAEILVALSVLALGYTDDPAQEHVDGRRARAVCDVGIIHGYALGESIYGAEPTPLYAYLLGLAVIQSDDRAGSCAFDALLAKRSPMCRRCGLSAPALRASASPY